jgi:carbonic anhydrase/acetyltransferase-like protein (isoleucine patch superfamily)
VQGKLAKFWRGRGCRHGRIVDDKAGQPGFCSDPYNQKPNSPTISSRNPMAIYQLDDLKPVIHESAWVADSAQVMGDVTLAEGSSVWFGVVVRGDTETITVGKGSNIQDNSVLHADHGMPLVIGEQVTVGHQVMLHGCTIGDGSLIGIQAVVLNGAKIGKNCLVGAGSLVTEGKEFPDGCMILGSPAKAVRQLTDAQIEGLKMSAQHYMDNARRYKAGLKKLD